MTSDFRMDGCEGEKDNPGKKPDRQHDADHHAEETDKKVAVQSVDILDLVKIRIEDRSEPS
jgi:hypothetical protein